jgi:glycerophosphoryl diester phosphodiesterase
MAKDQSNSAGDSDRAKPRWNVRQHVPLQDFVIQSHRGAGELAPENTIEAFELGWKLGTYPEADIRTTKDHVIVAFHDANFKRVVKNIPVELQSKGVADVSFAELSRLDVGSWKGDQFLGRHVSRIEEVFERMKGHPERHLYLDIKNVDLKQLADQVKNAGVGAQVVLASPRHEIIREWKALIPASQTLLWVPGNEEAQRKLLASARNADFAGITQVQLHVHPVTAGKLDDGFTPSAKFITEVSEELAKRNILLQTLPYDLTGPEIYPQLLNLGVASFATDHPDVTLKAVRDYYSQSSD